MNSWRLTINEIDRSQTIVTSVGSTGAMVLVSERGPSVPVSFSPGQEIRLRYIFGWPMVGNEDVWDAIQYNKQAQLWASGMFGSTDTCEGIEVTSTGVTAKNTSNAITGANITNPAYTPYSSAPNTTYFWLSSKFPNANNFLKAQITLSTVTNLFTMYLYIVRNGSVELYGTYVFNLTPGSTANFGASAYILDVFKNHDLVKVYLNPAAILAAFPTSGSGIDSVLALGGGAKAVPSTAAYAAAWTSFQNGRQYAADIFMDTSGDDTLMPSTFDSLSKNNQKYSDFLWVFPRGNTPSEIWTVGSGLRYASPGAGGINNRNVHLLYNWAWITYAGNGESFWSNCIGPHGVKYAQMTNVFNALSPSWVDENNHGGQMSNPDIQFFEQDPIEDDLQALDTAGVNARVYDPSLGPIITSDKTGKTPSILSDDSYVGSSRLFNYLIKNIAAQVLIFQITKLNDTFHQRLAGQKGMQILQPVKDGGFLNDFKIKCDGTTGSNDAAAKAARQFVYSVAVQIIPNAQFLVFNFIKVGATITVDAALP